MKKKSTAARIWAAIGISAAFLVGYLLIQVVVSVAASVLFAIFGTVFLTLNGVSDTGEMTERLSEFLLKNTSLILIVSATITLAVTFTLVGVLYRKKKWKVADAFILKHHGPRVKTVFSLILCFVCGLCFNVALVNLLELLPIPQSWLDGNSESVDAVMQGNIVVVILAVAVFAPLVEEVLFRGMAYTLLRDAIPLKRCWAVLISGAAVSIVFGIYHGNVLQALYAGLFSILLVAVREKTGSVWGPVLMHMGFNASSWVVSLLYMLGLYQEDKTVLNFVVYLILSAALLAAILMLAVDRKQYGQCDDDSACNYHGEDNTLLS